MSESRNPFLLRASEKIDSDAMFIRFFGVGVLEALPPADPWRGVKFLRSAEGGGKTSLLRLLTPEVLHSIVSSSDRDDCKELYRKMTELGAIDQTEPDVLGVLLSFGRNYASLEDLDIDALRSERLFYSLLNARIVLATLRAVSALKRVRYPEDLDRFQISPSSNIGLPDKIQGKLTGRQIYDWAVELEQNICNAIDSFGPANLDQIVGSESISSLLLISPDSITFEGSPVSSHVLLMLDDLQKLTRRQREKLITVLVEARSTLGIWISERLEALSEDEVLSSGAKAGRDQTGVIELECYWRDNWQKFRKFVFDIADRRARESADDIDSFTTHLSVNLDNPKWTDKYVSALETVRRRVHEEIQDHASREPRAQNLFKLWLAEAEKYSGSPKEMAVRWRSLEILIERERGRTQPTLFDEPMSLGDLREAIPVDDFNKKNDSPIKASAELFLADEFGFPYYFGENIVARLASANVEQFLGLAGNLFEEMISARVRDLPADLEPLRQEQLLAKAADVLWNDIPRMVHSGHEVRSFLDSIGRFSKWMTYRPTAPNDIGVSGIAISMHDRNVLLHRAGRWKDDYQPLQRILTNAIAHNLLEPQLDYSVKNGTWLVLNLNRLLCIRYRLPLHRGKFKEKSLEELISWMHNGFQPPRGGPGLLI